MRWMWRAHKLFWNLSGGRLGNQIGDMRVLELVTIGNKTGEERSVLLYHLESPDGALVAGSNLGSDSDPAWVKNLRAEPRAIVRSDGYETEVQARFLEGDERRSAFRRFKDVYEDYQRYEDATDRQIPVVLLQPVDSH